MLRVLGSVWALLIGMILIMIGNGMQSTLMGVRGGIEGFSTSALSIITAGYFVGFLAGSRAAPVMIRRVGHVRVFAALGSFMSAGLIAFPLIADPVVWTVLRVILGFCLSGVYVTAESWLNNAADNQTRGKVLSAYMIAQTLGMVTAQGLLNLADAAGFVLFVLSSILVSLSFAPILLSASPVPVTEATRAMTLAQLYRRSPLGTVGTLLLGGVFAAQMGMAAVYGAKAGLAVGQVSAFIAAIFVGSLALQYPIGWLSDRMDRRLLILVLGMTGAAATWAGFVSGGALPLLLGAAFLMGGMANPLYSLLIAYTNDYLELEEMPAASSALVFIYGIGAIAGPLVTGGVMNVVGPDGFWLVLSALFLAIAGYAAWRMTRRPAIPVEETGAYVGVLPTSSPVAVEAAQEWVIDNAEEAGEDEADL